MKRDRLAVIGVLVGLAVLVFLVLRDKHKKPETNKALATTPAMRTITTQPTQPPISAAPAQSPSQAEQRKEAANIVTAAFSAPISFYGKVQDQNGNAVSEAKVQYGAIDKFWEPGSNYNGLSDFEGSFSISGIKGAGLTVGVSKEGYDGVNGLSYQSFGYGMPPDTNRKAPPSKSNPAIFVLRKKAQSEPMVTVRSRQYDTAKDGTPAEVNLETGMPVAAGRGQLRVECWANEQAKDAQGHFDWRCRVSVPGGGLLARNPEYDFEAPEDGYRATDEIVMGVNNPQQRWSSQAERDYFVKLPDSRYARLKLTAFAGKRTFFVLESYLNPSGSRNLEYDPSKPVSAR